MEQIGIIGAGAMGSGIAQVAATNGHQVFVYEVSEASIEKAKKSYDKIFTRLVEKGKFTASQADEIKGRISFSTEFSTLQHSTLVIEAIVENLEVKKKVFSELEKLVSTDCVLASNTSSLSIAALSSALENPSRLLGIHFFNPAPLMPLVEIIPGIPTDEKVTQKAKKIIDSWGKVTVLAKDTPGFIVNRIARPFYGEAIRIYEEGIADFATIDWAMKTIGGFRMGPFELMDFIGNDVNYAVTETVFKEFFYDPRYKPSFTQKRLAEAGWLGRKSGRGYYNYSENAVSQEPKEDMILGKEIFMRIISMLINEAYDALYLKIASAEDIELAMTKGVNYPKGLLAWGKEIGLKKIKTRINTLRDTYQEDRYRLSVLLS